MKQVSGKIRRQILTLARPRCLKDPQVAVLNGQLDLQV